MFTAKFHLRRLHTTNKDGGPAVTNKVDTCVLLDRRTKVGRNHEKCDIILSSSHSSTSTNMISRDHAEIIGRCGASGMVEGYTIIDNSLNGTYVNDFRIRGPYELKEGDVIKFGHMNGAAVKPGQEAPQAFAEFSFIVEKSVPTMRYLGFSDDFQRIRSLSCTGDSMAFSELAEVRYERETKEPPMPIPAPPQPSKPEPVRSHPLFNTLPTTLPAINSSPMPSATDFSWFLQQNLQPNLFLNLQQQLQQQQQAAFPVSLSGATLSPALMAYQAKFVSNLQNPSSFPLFPTDANAFNQLFGMFAPSLGVVTPSLPTEIPKGHVQTVNKPAVASPPMECDSSVPSPPKTIFAPEPRLEKAVPVVCAPPMQTMSPSLPSVLSPSMSQTRQPILSPRPAPVSAPIAVPVPVPVLSVPKPVAVTKRTEAVTRVDVAANDEAPEAIMEETIVTEKATPTSSRHSNEKAKHEKEENERALKSPDSTAGPSKASVSMRRLKQLSDESSASSDSSGDEAPPKSKPKLKITAKASAPPVKKAVSSESAENDSDSSENSQRKKKHKGKAGQKSSGATVKSKTKRTAEAKSAPKKKVSVVANQSHELDAAENVVVDKKSDCGMFDACSTPDLDKLDWMCCDLCDQWFHCMCITGRNEPYGSEKKFNCKNCVKKRKKI